MIDQSNVSAIPVADSALITSTAISVPERLMLGHNSDWWGVAMLWSLGFAALCAFAVVFTTAAVVRLQRQGEADAKAALETYKATVAGQIAEANRKGVEAGEAAGDAKKRAAEANERAAVANERAAKAELELAKYKAHRTIEPWQRAAFVAALQPSSGQEYILSVATSQEAIDLACLLDSLLTQAGWKRIDHPISNITVNTDCGRLSVIALTGLDVRAALKRTDETTVAADRLLNALVAAGITPRPGQDPVNLPNDHVVSIMVGAKQ